MFRTKINPRDGIGILAVLLLAFLLLWRPWTTRAAGTTLLISTPDGTVSYSLSEDRKIELTSNGVTLRVVIEDGAAFVAESDCPDHICQNSGKISSAGESILCAKAGIRLTVEGEGGDYDGVAG